MLDATPDIDSLSAFTGNTGEFIQRLRVTGKPVILTVDGEAAVVVQDAGSYQRLLEIAERAQTIEAIREGLREFDEGKGMSLEDAWDRVRANQG